MRITLRYLTLFCSLLLVACGGAKVGDRPASSSSCSSSSSSGYSSSSSSSSSSGMSISELKNHFASHACGVDFNALGNGMYQACYRTPAGGAECISYQGEPQTVVWRDSNLPVRDVFHVSGGGNKGSGVAVVTTSGQMFRGSAGSLEANPAINSGVVSTSNGYFLMCALIKNQTKTDVVCDQSDSQFKRPNGLPETFDAAQLVANNNSACALSTEGKVWCWPERGTAKVVDLGGPIQAISASFNFGGAICGLGFDGAVKCLNNFDNNGLLKNIASNARKIMNANALVTVDADGKAVSYLGETITPLAIKNIVASGGSDLGGGSAVFLTLEGDLYNSATGVKIPGAKAQGVKCPW
jgi:hypothetical protein